MPTPVNVAVIYYSATGTVATIAEAIAESAGRAGAEVRLRRVTELAPQAAIDSTADQGRANEGDRPIPTAPRTSPGRATSRWASRP